MIGETGWLSDIDGRDPFITATRSNPMTALANAISVAQRTSADLATDIAIAQREAARPGGTAATRLELEAMAANVETMNRTLVRLREQAE